MDEPHENDTELERRLERLLSENQRLSERVKRLILTESRLYLLQDVLDAQVRVYRHLYESGKKLNTECNQPDNIAVSPRGGIVLCEDGSMSVTQKLRGLTPEGGTFLFADNNVNLSEQDIKQADWALHARRGVIKRIAPGNYTGSEWAGACFYEKWMFVNIQSRGSPSPSRFRRTTAPSLD
jgi:secreted PhoX family phosphatase